MNPLKQYVKNRLEKLEEENKHLKENIERRERFGSQYEQLGLVFEKIIDDLELQIEYIPDNNVYHIYSQIGGNEKRTFYVAEANATNMRNIRILLETLPFRRKQ